MHPDIRRDIERSLASDRSDHDPTTSINIPQKTVPSKEDGSSRYCLDNL